MKLVSLVRPTNFASHRDFFAIIDSSGLKSMGIDSAGLDSASLGFEIYHKNSVADPNAVQIFYFSV